MKILKIDNNQGFFLDVDDSYRSVDKIDKERLLAIINRVVENEVTFDHPTEENLKNQAHKVIYQSLFKKLSDLVARKEQLKDESERAYLKEYERYKANPIDE
ncbi:MAG TPA: hypothetical protein VF275_12070 [Gammaproteobacteria bacterium]